MLHLPLDLYDKIILLILVNFGRNRCDYNGVYSVYDDNIIKLQIK